MDAKTILLTLCLAAASGCSGTSLIGEQPSPLIEGPPFPAAVPEDMPAQWQWHNGSFQWSGMRQQDAAIRLQVVGERYACEFHLRYQPTPAHPGWDAMVMIHSDDYQEFAMIGSSGSDVHVHAGPIHHDVSPQYWSQDFSVDWIVEGLTGTLEVGVGILLEAEEPRRFAFGIDCPGAFVSQAALGADVVIFGEGQGSEGASVNAFAFAAAPEITVVEGGSLSIDEQAAWLVAGAWADTYGHVSVDGPGGPATIQFLPDSSSPSRILNLENVVAMQEVGGAGVYSYSVTSGGAFGSVYGALLGVTPL